MIESKISIGLTEEYMRFSKESQRFDRKSAKIDAKDIANHIAGFANSDGGVLVIGISDNGELEGFDKYPNQENEFLKCTTTYLKTTPEIKYEKVNIINSKGIEDFILLLHIEISHNCLIRNVKDEVYLRRGDSTIKLNDDQIQVLKVDRPEISYEDQLVMNSKIEDIDEEMVEIYAKAIGADNKNYLDILRARRFLVERNGVEYLTIAGALLFAKDPTVFFPCARVRIVKYDGTYMQTGENLNIIKEKFFRLPLYKAIKEVHAFVGTQLREFSYLNKEGVFEKVPEYPEFAWMEGITNAITHRNYAMQGEHIKIFIYDDRMEIRSPGKLPGFVTLENMKNVRFARNTRISEVLLDLGLVKELNEGVSRIYEEMANFFLDEPKYEILQGDILMLTLKNNIVMRSKRKAENLLRNTKISEVWENLNEFERKVLMFIADRVETSTSEISKYTGRVKNTVLKALNKFEQLDLIEWIGTGLNDPKRKVTLK